MSNTRKRTWRPRFQSVKHRPEQNARVKMQGFWWALGTCCVASQLGLKAWCWNKFSSPKSDCGSIRKTLHKSCYDSQRIYLQGKKCQEHNHHRKNHNAYVSAKISHRGVLRECTTCAHFSKVCGHKQGSGQTLLPVTTRSLPSGHWHQHCHSCVSWHPQYSQTSGNWQGDTVLLEGAWELQFTITKLIN